MMKKIKFLVILLLLVLISCSLIPTPIGAIKQNTDRYLDNEVTVHGIVMATKKIPFLSDKVYILNDGTGLLTVIAKDSLPSVGDDVIVRGTLHSTARLLGHTFGVTLQEEHRITLSKG